MPKSPEIKTVPVREIPEVQRFVKAQQEYQAFKDANPEFFAALSHLIDQYNNAWEAANLAVQARGVSCGPFELASRPVVRWDGGKLYLEVGEEAFKKYNLGTVTTVQVVTVNKEAAENAKGMGHIPPSVVEECRSVTYRYHRPDKGSVL